MTGAIYWFFLGFGIKPGISSLGCPITIQWPEKGSLYSPVSRCKGGPHVFLGFSYIFLGVSYIVLGFSYIFLGFSYIFQGFSYIFLGFSYIFLGFSYTF